MIEKNRIPAQLWVGSPSLLEQKAIKHIQHYACATQSACNSCAMCGAIASKNHASCIWVHPEKGYTLEVLVPVFKALSFSLEAEQYLFIVLQKADLLNDACANKLLKVMEEPPQGYHFILLAENKQNIIPTIQSRCIITYNNDHEELTTHSQLFELFIHEMYLDKLHFYLEQYTINEQESVFFAEKVCEYYLRTFRGATEAGEKNKCKKYMHIIQQALVNPPMPGSTKLFLKNLFLKLREEKNVT